MARGVPLTLPGKRPGAGITKYITNGRNLDRRFWRAMLAEPEQACFVRFTRFAEPKIGANREEHWFSIRNHPPAAFAGFWRWSALTKAEFEKRKVLAFLKCASNTPEAPPRSKAMPLILHEAPMHAG